MPSCAMCTSAWSSRQSQPEISHPPLHFLFKPGRLTAYLYQPQGELMRIIVQTSAIALVVSASAAPLHAETLPVAGIYPAQSDAAAALNVIAVENFGGDKGASLSFEISDRLEGVTINQERYFSIVPTSGGDVDAVLRGSAATEVSEIQLDDRKVTKCKKRDKDRKCIDERVTYYECWQINVSLRSDVRLISVNGNELHRYREPLARSEQYCDDDYSTPSVDELASAMVAQVASNIRYDLAPVYRNQGIRVLENRKGMSRDDKRSFRNAVRLTKTDVTAACSGFEALEPGNPQHVSVLFNVGLCAEGQGELEKAAEYYRRALAAEPGKDYPTRGMRRIEDRYRADRQLAAHYGA